MSNYSNDVTSCRVSFFRTDEYGRPRKWYADEAVKFLTWRGNPEDGGKLIIDAFIEALQVHLEIPESDRLRYSGMVAVCLDPYHENGHPIAVRVP